MGRLVYIIGASGSGKDSVMQHIRNEGFLANEFIFAHRYITKPSELGGENYISLSEDEFKSRLNAGFFAMSWMSHGYSYGIGIEITYWLKNGFNVVVNGSREYLATASSIFPDIVVILIQVSPTKLKERLLKRGRESIGEIEKRMQRSIAFHVEHPNLSIINNDGKIEDTSRELVSNLLHLLEYSA